MVMRLASAVTNCAREELVRDTGLLGSRHPTCSANAAAASRIPSPNMSTWVSRRSWA